MFLGGIFRPLPSLASVSAFLLLIALVIYYFNNEKDIGIFLIILSFLAFFCSKFNDYSALHNYKGTHIFGHIFSFS